MTAWEPATEAEVAMRDALRANDQELYFRLLSRTDVLLPISAPTRPGQPPAGWGTWTTGGRTHVLAFTSAAALRACLGDNAGSNRRIPFADLAAGWPNHEWWLAVNPGLPVEGYLPAWFVSQLSRGDVRLPGRAMGARARLERAETLARTRPGMPPRDAASAAGSAPATGAASPAPESVPIAPRRPSRGGLPRVGTPSVPGPAPRPPVPAEPPRRAGQEDLPAAGQRHPSEPPRPAPGAGALPRTGRPSRFTPLASAAPTTEQQGPSGGWPAPTRPVGDGPAVGNGNSGPQAAPRRSFFDPSPARDPAASGGRQGDRAAPPTRFGRGSQPFPRRRPADAPADEPATRAFQVAADPAATQPIRRPEGGLGTSRGVDAPASGEEITQPLPPRRHNPLAEEPTRAFRVTAEPPLTGAPGRPDPSAEATQAIPQDRPGRLGPAEDLPESVAEPVSGPPAPRRGFTPIVIEGTIIESRDLTDPVESGAPAETAHRPSPAEAAPPPFGSPSPGPGLFVPSPPGPGPAEATPPPFGSSPPGPGLFDPSPPGPSAPASFNLGQPVASPPVPHPSIPTEAGGGLNDPGFDGRVDTPLGADRADSGAPSAGLTGSEQTGGESLFGGESVFGGDGPHPPADEPTPVEFEPANTVEEDLLSAASSGSTDTFLSTLLLARVLLPAAPDSTPGSRPGDPGFVWRTGQLDGETYVVVYTSPERLADHVDGDVDTVRVKFAQLIRRWPDEDWSFAVNPGTPVGAKLPGEQIVALANWAAEVGLGDDLEVDQVEAPAAAEPAARPRYAPTAVDPTRPTVMQKAIAPSQLAYYLDRGYDRVSGFVHRAGELSHLTTPAQLHEALGLSYPGSPFAPDADEIYVLRWPAHRPSLYRIPYGGQNESAMRAMEGWVIERPPFRGNGFAPGESSDVVAEFKVDSARLPHGAQLWRIGADGTERVVAELDTDSVTWRRVGEA
ncbi:SseB family protein [Micromonospora parva]|uniref:SseB family protein n=1 Tax=Micromonospora parva TaxID=1464048 RepID=UPI0004BEBF31|nr:SseB family protein [Micromonospora parva]